MFDIPGPEEIEGIKDIQDIRDIKVLQICLMSLIGIGFLISTLLLSGI